MRGQLTSQGQVDARKARADAGRSDRQRAIHHRAELHADQVLVCLAGGGQQPDRQRAFAANLIQQGAAVADVFQSTRSPSSPSSSSDLDQQVGLARDERQHARPPDRRSQQPDLPGRSHRACTPTTCAISATCWWIAQPARQRSTSVESSDGQVSINVGNHQLVDRDVVHPMMANTAAGRIYPGPVEPSNAVTFAATAGAAQPPCPRHRWQSSPAAPWSSTVFRSRSRPVTRRRL